MKELIQSKILTRFIVKALLYPEFLRDIDTTEVTLRHRHKTFVRIHRNESSSQCYSTDSENSSERLERQNAIEYTSGEDSRIYSDIRCQTSKNKSWDRTVYESFIDHGERADDVRYHKLNDSINSFCFVTDCDSPSRESFMIGSMPVACVEDKYEDYNDNSVIHLATAKMNLLDIKQKSEQSPNSSFEHRLSNGWNNMACENLSNIDDCKVKTSHKQCVERHHSMPIQFVGNRFNMSSLTEIYIPSCKSPVDSVKNQMATPFNSLEEEPEEQNSHSSLLHIPSRAELTMEVPNLFTAGILYSMDRLGSSQKGSITSEESTNEGKTSKQSYPVFSPNPQYDNKRCDSKFMPPATIYSSDSDSGITGSYTLSPDQVPFGYHRSFISHRYANATPSSTDCFAQHTISDPMNMINQRIFSDFIDDKTGQEKIEQPDSTDGENKSRVLITFESSTSNLTCNNTYYSGMYAHWWKKEKLPVDMIRAIIKSTDDDRGSGKRNSKN